MKTGDITVEMRLSAKPDAKVKAFADVTITLGDDGTVTVLGFSVLESDGRPARVMAPARKGQKAWFDTVQLTGRIRQSVETVVLSEYERKTKGTAEFRAAVVWAPKAVQSGQISAGDELDHFSRPAT